MNRIKELRARDGLTQGGLAERLKVHQTAVSQWEKEKTMPDIYTLRAMAAMFGVSVDYILGEDEGQRPSEPAAADGIDALREEIRRRPEMKDLFDAARKVSDDDLRRAVKIIEALSK